MIGTPLPRYRRSIAPVRTRNGVIAGALCASRPVTSDDDGGSLTAEDARTLILMSLALTPLPRTRAEWEGHSA